MKREELEALGLTKEQVDKVLNMHHTEFDPVKKECETAQEDLKKDLEEFKDADVSGMKKKIEDLESDSRVNADKGSP